MVPCDSGCILTTGLLVAGAGTMVVAQAVAILVVAATMAVEGQAAPGQVAACHDRGNASDNRPSNTALTSPPPRAGGQVYLDSAACHTHH